MASISAHAELKVWSVQAIEFFTQWFHVFNISNKINYFLKNKVIINNLLSINCAPITYQLSVVDMRLFNWLDYFYGESLHLNFKYMDL